MHYTLFCKCGNQKILKIALKDNAGTTAKSRNAKKNCGFCFDSMFGFDAVFLFIVLSSSRAIP